jgi:hypothetical protein
MAGEEKSPVEKAKAWLRTQGYALEHAALRGLERAGFEGSLGRTYVDPVTAKVRDIDIIATPPPSRFTRSAKPVGIYVVIECKGGGGQPWIVRKATVPYEQLAWHPVGSPSVVAFAKARNERPFHVSEPTGIALLSARDKGEEDRAYVALRQLLDAAVGAPTSGFLPSQGAWLVHPVLVVEAPLVTVNYLDDGSEDVSESDRERIVWSGAGELARMIDVVQSEFFPSYAETLRDELQRLESWLARNEFEEGPPYISLGKPS